MDNIVLAKYTYDFIQLTCQSALLNFGENLIFVYIYFIYFFILLFIQNNIQWVFLVLHIYIYIYSTL